MDAEAFRNFERAAHERVAGGYHDFFEPMTGGAIMALLDAARVRAGCRVLDVASGPGGVAAAAAERGASRVIGADLSSRMVALAATLHAGASPPPGLPAARPLQSHGHSMPSPAPRHGPRPGSAPMPRAVGIRP